MNDIQKQFIRDHYANMTRQELAEELGVSRGAVAYFISKDGLVGKNRLKLTDDQQQLIRDNYMSMTYSELGAQCGLSADQIEGWVRNHIKDKRSKRRIFHKDYFHNIDTPDKAYWLGFIYADGWISGKDNSHFSCELGIELQCQDRYLLELFNKCLGNVHRIYDKDRHLFIVGNQNATHARTSLIRIYSRQIVDDLNSHGIDYNKTATDTFPIVDDNLFPDFLRGYIDGDGCIHHMHHNHLAVHITSANKAGLEYVRDKLQSLYNIEARIYSEDIDGYRTKYRLYCFRSEDVRKLLDIIYYDDRGIKLQRKYQIYLDHYGLAA